MADLYEQLGVARDATREAIKKAFRRKARDAHPDTGGSAEKFHALELAHRILSDEDRRAKYDRDGSTEAEVDTTDAQAMSIIASDIDRLMTDEDAIFKNMVAEIRKAIHADIKTAEQSIDNGRKFELRTIDLRKRVKGGKGAAFMISVFDGKLRDAAQVITSLEKQIAIRRRALEIIEDAEFDAEKRPQRDSFSFFDDSYREQLVRDTADRIRKQSPFYRKDFGA